MKQVLVLMSVIFLAGCNVTSPFNSKPTYDDLERDTYLQEKSENPSAYLRDITSVFNEYNLIIPNGNRIRVCSAYSCTNKQVYRLSAELLKSAKNKFSGSYTAQGERDGLGQALALVEQEMGPATNTDSDIKGNPWTSNGSITQMNHIDEALNTTSILLVMFKYNLIRYHDLLSPDWVSGTFYARIRDRSSGEIYAIDTGFSDSGGEVKIFNVRNVNP